MSFLVSAIILLFYSLYFVPLGRVPIGILCKSRQYFDQNKLNSQNYDFKRQNFDFYKRNRDKTD